MAFQATALYVGLNALILAGLGVRVVTLRFREKVAYGDGGHKALFRAIRAHANAAEYMPLALAIVALTEAMGGPSPVVHLLGGVFTLGRLSHAYALSGESRFRFRQFGMAATFLVYLLGGLGLVGHALM